MRLLLNVSIIAAVVSNAFTSFIYADDKQFIGEIIGIHAKAPLNDLIAGKIKYLSYGGKLKVMLDNGQKVDVTYPEDRLSDLMIGTKFNAKEIGGVVASITIDVKEKQKVLLIRNLSNEWEVAKILK